MHPKYLRTKHLTMSYMRYSFLCLLTFMQLSCEPLEVELIRTDEEGKYNGTIVYISNNDVFLTDAGFDQITRLTNTPGEVKFLPALHPSKQKIAYLNADRTPVIIDTTGVVLEQLDTYTNVRDMGWSADGETLFMLINLSLQFYGPPLPVPDITFPLGVNYPEIYSVDINHRNELAYTYSYSTFFSQSHGLIITSLDPAFATIEDSGPYQERYAARFSNDGNVLTYAIENRESLIFYFGTATSSAELWFSARFSYLYRSNDKDERLVFPTSNAIVSSSYLSEEYTRRLENLDNFGRLIELDYQ